jgi:hypothetical protein
LGLKAYFIDIFRIWKNTGPINKIPRYF